MLLIKLLGLRRSRSYTEAQDCVCGLCSHPHPSQVKSRDHGRYSDRGRSGLVGMGGLVGKYYPAIGNLIRRYLTEDDAYISSISLIRQVYPLL
jgi:hypothetical protein